jgi:hypothetical protein
MAPLSVDQGFRLFVDDCELLDLAHVSLLLSLCSGVASIPSFEPRLTSGDAGSSVSVGVLLIMIVSRDGSALVVTAHITSLMSCTLTSLSTTMNIFVSASCPMPHSPIITFFA